MVTMAPSHISNTHTHTHTQGYPPGAPPPQPGFGQPAGYPPPGAGYPPPAGGFPPGGPPADFPFTGRFEWKSHTDIFLMLIQYFRRAKCNEEAGEKQLLLSSSGDGKYSM